MRQRHFCDFTREAGALRRPITKGRSEAVHGHVSITQCGRRSIADRHLRKRPAQLSAREHKLALSGPPIISESISHTRAAAAHDVPLPAFIRSAGIVQSRRRKSISLRTTPSASLVRLAVRSGTQERARKDCSPLRKRLQESRHISVYERAAWCTTFRTLPFAGRRWSRCPRHCAGFHRLDSRALSPNSRMTSMRPRNREAVSGFVVQIGSRIFRTRSVSIRLDG